MASILTRPTEIIVPTRLGRSFRWLLAATLVNNIGDGIVLAAGPLLVASQTSDPFLVSMAVLAEYLPVLLFGVLGGAAADRFDRRRMVIVVNLGRALALVVLVATIVSGTVSIAVVLVDAVHPRARPRRSPTRRAARSSRTSWPARISASRTPGCRARSC